MDESHNTTGKEKELRPAPELPRLLLDPWPLAITGTVLWFIAFLVMVLTNHDEMWQWTTLTGVGLGILGMAVMLWQRIGRYRRPQQLQSEL